MNRRERNRIIMNLLKKGIYMDDIKKIKKSAQLHDMFSILSIMYQTPRYAKFLQSKVIKYDDLLLCKFPHIFTGQFREEVLIQEIIGEVRFLTCQILLEYNKINDFLVMRNKFETLFMRGEFEEAISLVKNFEKNNGFSFWGIDSILCTLSYSDVSKADKFCDEIMEKCNNSSVKAYINIGRFRFLKDVTGVYFRAQSENIIQEYDECENESNLREAFKRYLKINVDISRGLDLNDIRYLLIICNYISLFDRYLILEKILGWLCSEAVFQEGELNKCTYECAMFLKEKISCYFWKNICTLLGDNEKINIKDEKIIINDGLKLFCNGNEKEAYNYCEKMLMQYSNSFPLINLMAKSGECLKSTIPYLELSWFVRRLYLKKGKDEEFIEIVELCNVYERIYSFFSFGNNLAVIIENETRPIMLQGKISYVNALLSLNFTPSKLAYFLPESRYQIFLSKYIDSVGDLFFSDWQISIFSDMKKELESYYIYDQVSHMLNMIKENSYSEEKLLLEIKGKNIIFENICISFYLKKQFDCFVKEEKLLDAINLYVKSFFISQWMVIKMDSKKIDEKITRKLKCYLENHLSYCIYAFITRFELCRGENISETVVNSCRKILKNKGVSAADIKIPTNELDRKKILYFLRYICTYDGLRRINMRVALAQELYSERLQIIKKIIPYYDNSKDRHVLDMEMKKIIAKMEYLDIAKCINKGKINTGWIVFSDYAQGALISIYNIYNNSIEKNNWTAYLDAFVIVKKDYVQEVNRILSITIRHGILEGELLRFLKRGKINADRKDIKDGDKKSIERFYKQVYELIDELLDNYIVSTYKYEMDTKLLLYVDDNILFESFRKLPEKIESPEDIERVYSEILKQELENRLPSWSKKITSFIDKEMRLYLNELYKDCTDVLKTDVNKTCDLLGEEIEKLKQWFSVTENQEVTYRLATLGDVLEQEWGCVEVCFNVNEDTIVKGNVINLLYTIIRELIWNAEKYSGYKEDDTNFKIYINMYTVEDNIVFEVKNNIKEYTDINNSEENINEINEIIEEVEKYDVNERTRKDIREGKSGYRKIVKLLKRVCDNNYKIVPKLDNGFFKVKMTILMEALF